MPSNSAVSALSETELDQIAQKLYRDVERIDRKSRNKWYDKCFVGKEATTILVEQVAAANGSRREAVRVGQMLLDRK